MWRKLIKDKNMKNQNKINDINFLEKFEISELEQRLENRWCTTTVTDKDGNVHTIQKSVVNQLVNQ